MCGSKHPPRLPGDADTGPNNLQNYPILTGAAQSPGFRKVEGTLNSTPNTAFRIEFFVSDEADPTGYGEGQHYVWSTQVTTDSNGDASFEVEMMASPAGNVATATATDPAGNTSEFSPAISFDTANQWYYTYDVHNRLINAYSGGWTPVEFLFDYDGAGNATYFERWNSTNNAVEAVLNTYNGANQLVSSCVDANFNEVCETVYEPVVNYDYDIYGNLISDGASTYTYDAEMRLTSVTKDGVVSSYAYSGDGDRLSQTVGGVTTTYVIDTATPLTMVLAETTNGVTTKYWHGLDVIAQSDGTNVKYFQYDALGSVRQVADGDGVVELTQTFDPYGNGYIKSGSASTTLGFTGEQTDSSGFVFLRARYYNPRLGRFIQLDPGRFDQNPYLYAAGNPIIYTDPSGLCVFAGVDTLLCSMLLGGLIGATASMAIATIYAGLVYDWADSGQCGCSMQVQIKAVSRAEFIGKAVDNAVLFGFVLGALAGAGPAGAFATSMIGAGFAGTEIIAAGVRVLENPDNKCAMLDLGIALAGYALSYWGAKSSIDEGLRTGQWITGFPPEQVPPGDDSDGPSVIRETPDDELRGGGGGKLRNSQLSPNDVHYTAANSDPAVVDVGNHIRQQGLSPLRQNMNVRRNDTGAIIAEIDLEYPKAFVEIKGGAKLNNPTQQFERYNYNAVNPSKKPVLFWASDSITWNQRVARERVGYIVFGPEELPELVSYLLGLHR